MNPLSWFMISCAYSYLNISYTYKHKLQYCSSVTLHLCTSKQAPVYSGMNICKRKGCRTPLISNLSSANCHTPLFTNHSSTNKCFLTRKCSVVLGWYSNLKTQYCGTQPISQGTNAMEKLKLLLCYTLTGACCV